MHNSLNDCSFWLLKTCRMGSIILWTCFLLFDNQATETLTVPSLILCHVVCPTWERGIMGVRLIYTLYRMLVWTIFLPKKQMFGTKVIEYFLNYPFFLYEFSFVMICTSNCNIMKFSCIVTCFYSDPFHEVKRKRDKRKEV